jgi:beta-N-acetylhexosaminidase
VSSPFGFIKDSNIGTYICTYDFTPNAMESLVQVLFGDLAAVGMAPSTVKNIERVSHVIVM